MYFQYRGEYVEDAYVVIYTVKSLQKTSEPFSLRMDQGLIFKFNSGYVSLVKGGVTGLDINISRAVTRDVMEMYDTSFEWPNSLEQQFDFQRSVVSLAEIESWEPNSSLVYTQTVILGV